MLIRRTFCFIIHKLKLWHTDISEIYNRNKKYTWHEEWAKPSHNRSNNKQNKYEKKCSEIPSLMQIVGPPHIHIGL